MEKKVPSFLKMYANPCYYSENRQLRNLQPSTPPVTDLNGPRLHERTSKHNNIFESLTVYVSVCTILCTRIKYSPKGQT